jgi:hypothetical protein
MNDFLGPMSRLSEALSQQGFRYSTRTAAGWLLFEGELDCDGEGVPVEVSVDPRGLRVPEVRLQTLPQKLQGTLVPHLSPDRTLCYVARGSVVLDVFDLAGQTLRCLEVARDVLAKIIRGELAEDVADEFFAYWGGTSYFVDLPRSGSPYIEQLLFVRPSSADRMVLTADADRTALKMKAAGYVLKRRGLPVKRVTATSQPKPSAGNWPPKTLGDLLAWQTRVDKVAGKALKRHVTRAFRRQRGHSYLVECPTVTYGFEVMFNALPRFEKGKRRPAVDRKRLFRSSGVKLFNTVPIDDEYLASRSTPDTATLAGKRIMLVGCGTIGGFLADLLVKMGAGVGGGELTLVDNDYLMPQNIGRHRLGFGSILQNKATALASDLARGAPTAKIRPLREDVAEVNVGGVDLVVDATGEEALGHWLAAKLQRSFVPSLFVWIEGPGTAVRGLLRDTKDAACLRCLSAANRAARYPTIRGELPSRFAGQGCESLYVPFPVTVSVQAACLGAEMVSAWMNGSPSPKLRTRVLDPTFCAGSQDLDPERLLGCPACSM